MDCRAGESVEIEQLKIRVSELEEENNFKEQNHAK